jgi:hypothetical protein
MSKLTAFLTQGATYENALKRPIVDFGDEDLNAEAGCNDSSEGDSSNDGEGNLEQLPLEALRRREEAYFFARDRVSNLLLRCKIPLPEIDVGYTLDAPAYAKVSLLLFPVFGEDGAPQSACESVDGREGAEEEPREETESGSWDEEGEVGLCEGEVESDLYGLAHDHIGGLIWAHLLS